MGSNGVLVFQRIIMVACFGPELGKAMHNNMLLLAGIPLPPEEKSSAPAGRENPLQA